MSFWSELKRRNVVKVGAAYAIVAWLIVQIANTFFPILHLPEWAVTLVACLLILGFPIALIHAWAYEVTPDGIKRSKEVPIAESITHLTGKKLDYILGGLLVITVAYILFDNYYLDRRFIETEVASRVAELVPPADDVEETEKTIAVLPFEDLSPEKDQEYFVDGLSEEIINYLAQIPGLTVIARTSSFSFKGTTKKIQEIGSDLGVAHVLEGSVRKAGNALRITAQLIKAADDSHLWSKTYDKEFKVEEMFSVQEDIAIAVANELKLKLGVGESPKQLGGTDNEKAYELYLVAKALYREGPAIVSQALEPIDTAVALDSYFALAWAWKSRIYSSFPSLESKNTALKAAQRAIELEPALVDGYIALSGSLFTMGEWIEAKIEGNKAFELITEPSLHYEAQSPMNLWYMGHLEEAIKIIEVQLRNDPLNSNFHMIYLKFLAEMGDVKQFEEGYERSRALLGVQWDTDKGYISQCTLLSGSVMSIDNILYSNPIYNAAKENLGSPEEAVTELLRIYDYSDDLTSFEIDDIMSWVVYFSFPDLTMDIIERQTSRTDFHFLEVIWSQLFHEVRQLRRFKELVREIGLVGYWEQFGWPDLCKPTGDGDFVCE